MTVMARPIVARPAAPRTQAASRLPTLSLVVIFASWASVFTLYHASIGGKWDPVGTETWLWLVLWVAVLAMSFQIAVSNRRQGRTHIFNRPNANSINRTVMLLCGLIIVGVVLFIFDFAILRGYGFVNAAAAIRAEEVNAAISGASSSSAFSGLGRLLIPAFLPTISVVVLFWRKLSTLSRVAFFGAMILLLVQQLFFEGGRFLLASTAVIIVFAYLVFPKTDGAQKARKAAHPLHPSRPARDGAPVLFCLCVH